MNVRVIMYNVVVIVVNNRLNWLCEMYINKVKL